TASAPAGAARSCCLGASAFFILSNTPMRRLYSIGGGRAFKVNLFPLHNSVDKLAHLIKCHADTAFAHPEQGGQALLIFTFVRAEHVKFRHDHALANAFV